MEINAVAVLLAAGTGSRFEGPGHKLMALLPPTDDRPAERVIDRTTSIALRGLGVLAVVTGRTTGARPAQAVIDHHDVTVIVNGRSRDGQATSVQCGVEFARARGAEVMVVGLGDQPGATPHAWRAVAEAANTDTPIAVATYDGRRANPVALHRNAWKLLATDGDEGARTVMRLHPELVVEVPCTGSPHDIDTVEDLRRWQSN